jgi:hypothetical protein
MRSLRIDRKAAVYVLALVIIALAAPLTAGTLAAHAPRQSGLPLVLTGSVGAGHLRGSGVELRGSIDPNGEATTYYFQYGPTVAYGEQTPTASLPVGTTRVKVNQAVTGLEPGDHYRLVAMNGHGPADGQDRTYFAVSTKKTTPGSKKTRLRFTLSRPPATGRPLGSSFSVDGALLGPGAANHPIVLQASSYPYRAAYTTVGAPRTTDSAGRFSFFVASLTRNTKYRVATLDSQLVYSPVITELAAVHVTFHARSATHGGLVRLYGTVSPAEAGATVFFQLQRLPKTRVNKAPKSEKAEERAEERAEEASEEPQFATKFSAPVKRATKTISRFSSVVAIRLEGTYRAYVEVPKGPLASGYSKSIPLHASAKKRGRRSSG